MKKLVLLFSFLCINLAAFSQDTVWVQTFTWDSTARVGNFDFPDEPANAWQKVIMLYNMRCHDLAVGSGNVGCREWDYSCNTFIMDSTLVDSTRFTTLDHFITDFVNQAGLEFRYSTQPVYSYYKFTQQDVAYTNVSGERQSQVGAEEMPLTLVQGTYPTLKTLFLFSAAELTNAGVSPGKISGMGLNITTAGGEARYFKVRMKETTNGTVEATSPELDGFTTVYFKDSDFTATGNKHLKFSQDFDWDGNSNVLVEISVSEAAPLNPIQVMSQNIAAGKGIATPVGDNYFEFNGGGSVHYNGDMSAANDAVTIAFWSYGIADVLPVNTSAFEGVDAGNNRQVNVHLPWSNGRIYWDCGNDGSGYDRIDKQANPEDFEGQWNHFAFTKDATTGVMNIYLNGVLWHTGSGNNKTVDIQDLIIGANINGGNGYQGALDEFMIFDKALDVNEVQSIMHQSLAASPLIGNIVAYFPMNELTGTVTSDPATMGQTASINGSVGRKKRYGDQLRTGFAALPYRPTTTFYQGTYTRQVTNVDVLDSLQNTPNMVVSYGVSNSELVVLDTQFVWDVDRSFVFNEDGTIDDFLDVTPENTIVLEELEYFTKAPAKFEILSLVTPYGNGLDLGPEGVTFNIDVTDYAPILRGTKRMSMELGGQNQEEMDIRFMFVRGTPPRDVKSIQNIWPFRRGYFDEILNDRYFEPRNVQLNQDAENYMIRASITGHQQNGEFTIRNHYFNINGGNKEFNFDVFKECSDIPIYPQGGTWIFDRAGWCPGDPTQLHQYDITDMSSGGNVEIDYGLNGATMTEANYLVSAQLVSYGPINFTNDAEVIEIIRPTNQLEFARHNPACNYPTVRIRNNGSEALRTLVIEYGEKDQPKLSYNWSGNLMFGETEDVELPLEFFSFWKESDEPGVFEVSVRQPNGNQDEYMQNNVARSNFERPQVFDRPIAIEIKTNLRPAETKWRLKGMDGQVLLERQGADANTLYSDEFSLGRGCYTLEIEDSGDDGLYYWYWEQTGQSRGRGSAKVMNVYPNGIKIAAKTFEPEFGRFIQFDLAVPEDLSSTVEAGSFELIGVHPNPTTDFINLDLEGFENQTFDVQITDTRGQQVMLKQIRVVGESQQEQLMVIDLPAGMYFVRVTNGDRQWVRQFVKL
ncbi:MAG: T9SS type A sorting domain-containing protein [Saprospiraceae bacterium]|nr:T9SS type A sorting domain-containing protein [Saprospiraceae bacterium]